MFAIEGTIERDDRKRIVGPALVERMLGRQRGGHDNGINLALPKMFNATHFIVRLIFRTRDQKLIATLTCLAFKIISNAGIAGIFQIRNHQTNRARSSGA